MLSEYSFQKLYFCSSLLIFSSVFPFKPEVIFVANFVAVIVSMTTFTKRKQKQFQRAGCEGRGEGGFVKARF